MMVFIQDLFRPIKAVFLFSGVWSPYYKQPVSWKSICYDIYSVCYIGLLVIYLLQQFVEFLINIDTVDVDDTSRFVCYAAQHTVGLIKLYIIISKKDEVRPLFKQMERPPFDRPHDDFYNRRLSHHVQISRKFIFSFWFVIYMTMVFQCAVSISRTLSNKRQFNAFCVGDFNETTIDFDSEFDCSKSVLVIPWMAYFPFDIYSFPGYQIAFIYEWFLLGFFAKAIFNFDMFVMVWMMALTLQFEVLCNDLLNLRENVVTTLKTNNETIISKEIIKRLKIIVNYHIDLLEFFVKSNKVMTWILFVQYFWMSILICMILTQLSMSSLFSMQFIHGVFYGFVATFQLYIVFYYANETMLEGLKIADAAFYSQWYLSNEYSPQIKPYIIFLIRRANMRIQLQAGKVFSVDLAGFLKVGKASYSYYALINTK